MLKTPEEYAAMLGLQLGCNTAEPCEHGKRKPMTSVGGTREQGHKTEAAAIKAFEEVLVGFAAKVENPTRLCCTNSPRHAKYDNLPSGKQWRVGWLVLVS